jgi:cytochrome c oxidase subunit 3
MAMPIEDIPLEPVQEQFVDADQQREAVTLGMWIFLATEVLFFGGLLLAYSVYRHWYFADFCQGSRHLDLLLGTTNTAILITSSLFMSAAITAGRLQDRRPAILLLVVTALCGLAFICIKGYEWHTAISDGFWPSNPNANIPHGEHLFYSLYFCLTGLHGLHLLIGVVFLLGTAVRFARLPVFRPNQNYLSLLGLYWHFVDVVWLFLYPLLYFIGRSS